MSTREYASAMLNEVILNEVPEEKLYEVIENIIETLHDTLDRGTIMRLESLAFRLNPHPKTYNSFEEILKEIEDEDEDEDDDNDV